MRWRLELTRRPDPPRQLPFPFLARRLGRERRFKTAIAATTLAVVVAAVAGTPAGRHAALAAADRVRWVAIRQIGLDPPREEIDAHWRRTRERGIAQARQTLREIDAEASPAYRKLLRAVGMGPDSALLRWGNYDRTLVLSSKVFEPDEKRSYRLRPDTRSVWLRRITIAKGLAGLFLVPDLPEMHGALPGTEGLIVPESVQTTNSWGCRGPEPDRNAALRGLVLGDSFMQGMLIGDDDTPPACLERYLAGARKESVSILNTGHLGYSVEQYYHTLLEYFDRFRPHFVLLSLFANDFGDTFAVSIGGGDWEEGRYWVGEIVQFCRSHEVLCVVAPVPLEGQLAGTRHEGYYPGPVSNIVPVGGKYYVNPLDHFIDRNLELYREAEAAGHRPSTSPLFNGRYADGHFSALGSQLWAEVVGHRIALLLPPVDPVPTPRATAATGE